MTTLECLQTNFPPIQLGPCCHLKDANNLAALIDEIPELMRDKEATVLLGARRALGCGITYYVARGGAFVRGDGKSFGLSASDLKEDIWKNWKRPAVDYILVSSSQHSRCGAVVERRLTKAEAVWDRCEPRDPCASRSAYRPC